MAVAYCILRDTFKELPFYAAFQLNSKAEISPDLYFLGIGVIHRIGDHAYGSNSLYKLYETKGQKRNRGALSTRYSVEIQIRKELRRLGDTPDYRSVA